MMMNAMPKCIALCDHFPPRLGSQDNRLCGRLLSCCYVILAERAIKLCVHIEAG